ncbi:MAG: UDP-N-acetylmuramate dehydrogenase [Aphanocapsa lilacina HA4352-LM1]|jgi:UDP-N-acetylmuramate dehydrogenase|nr:UDP-N-acetylmuramate dehydrogenase [Aphanocapsa lilacina HA4352-LM1]
MKDQLQPGVSLALLTAYQVGGPAEWYLQPTKAEVLDEALGWARRSELPVTVIGAGTNLLISDAGIGGLVIHLRSWRGTQILEEGLIEVKAGESIAALTFQMARRGWAGLEWAVGVPGSIGGAVVMNAGAHGAQFSDTLESVEVLIETGERRRVAAGELGLAYRSSLLQQRDWVVLSARLRLAPGHEPARLIEHIDEFNAFRHRTQPSGFPNCGSVFRNPGGEKKAGWMLDRSGLKGQSVGAAQVAEQHANFILNRGGATARDILTLMIRMRDRVVADWGIALKPEVRFLGQGLNWAG